MRDNWKQMEGRTHRRPRKLSLWQKLRIIPRAVFSALREFWNGIIWDVQGAQLEARLSDKASLTRTEAQVALDRVVLETSAPHDCITATIVRGGPCIYVKHDGPHEAFIAHSYDEAAEKAIEWINAQGDELSFADTTQLSRKAQKVFDAQRRKIATRVREARRNNIRLN